LFGKPNIEKMRKKQDFKGLCKALGNKDEEVRNQASNTLVETLIVIFGREDAKFWDQKTIEFFTKTGGAVVEPLIAALNDKRANKLMQNRVICLLGQIRDTRAIDHIIPFLKDLSEVHWQRLRENAARALAEIGDKRVVEPVMSAIKSHYWDFSDTCLFLVATDFEKIEDETAKLARLELLLELQLRKSKRKPGETMHDALESLRGDARYLQGRRLRKR
jgi:HEAT repeat protein